MDKARYTIDDLMAEGFSRWTIYRYSRPEVGLLPPARSRGAGPNYTADHIKILRAVRRMQDENRQLLDMADVVRAQFPAAFDEAGD